MTPAPTDPTAWLATAPRLSLFARIRRRPQRGFWQRLFGSFAAEPRLGELVAGPAELRSTLLPGVVLSWAEPLVVQLSVWQPGGELGVTLRQQRGGGGEIGFRTLASSAWLEGLEVPAMQELHPFVLPEVLAPLWNALRWFASVHGRAALAPWPEPDAELLAADSAPPAQLCMSCAGYLLVSIGPQAYRCTQCGYEGGEGYAAMLQAERRSGLEALQGEARQARLGEILDDAYIALVDTVGRFTQVLGGSEDENKTARTAMLQAGAMQTVTHLRDARVLASAALDTEIEALVVRLEPATRGRDRPGRAMLEEVLAALERTRAQQRGEG